MKALDSNALSSILPAASLALLYGANSYIENSFLHQELHSQPKDFAHFYQNPLLRADLSGNNSFNGAPLWNEFQILQNLFEVVNPNEVYSFINSSIAKLLLELEPTARQYFEVDKIALEVRHDPEINDPVLLIAIFSKKSWEQSEIDLDTFDRNWWLKKVWIPSDKRICVDVFAA